MAFDNYITGVISPQQADFYLQQSFPFYKALNQHNRQKFVYRLCLFNSQRKYVPRKDLVLTEEMITLICACAIQLTFGLDNFMIDYFDTILVYPDIYQSPHSENKHHGEVNLAGFICFSWASLKKGIGKNDNFNVGLHEWSHALRFNGFRGNDGDPFFDSYFLKWLAVGNKLYNDIRTGRDHYFNKYAGSNIGEFFPVMMEHFFENPELFQKNYPIEYESTCVLLNLDPLNAMNPVADVRQKIFSLYNYKESPSVYMKSHSGRGMMPWLAPMIVVIFFSIMAMNASVFCSSIVLLLAVVPFVLFFVGKGKKLIFTENGLVRGSHGLDPLSKHTKKYPWEQVIRADFGDPASAGGVVYTYPYIHFTVTDGQEFKTLKFHTPVDKYEAEKYEKFFREKRVGVMMKNYVPEAYDPNDGWDFS